MPTHLLDTSVFCQPLKPEPLASVIARWSTLGDESLAISVLCEAEVLYGIRLKQSSRLQKAYDRLLRGRLEVLPVDAAVGDAFASLKVATTKRGRPISDIDLLIAATARAHRLTVATLNVRHFKSIEGIVVEDWSRSPVND